MSRYKLTKCNSNKVWVLHGHVVALFDEAVVCIDIAAWSNDRLRSSWVIDTCRSLGSESLLACVEYHCVLEMFIPRLTHRLRSALFWSSFGLLVKSWSRDFELETLSIEYLIVVKSRWRGVKTNSFASNCLIVTCSLTVLTPDIGLLNTGHLVLDTEDSILIVDVLALLALCHNLGLLSAFSSNYTDAGILCRVWQVKAVCRRSENCIAHCSLFW